MKDKIIDYHKLILDFQRINVVKTKTTIMDVSGYPHYENVASRILAFYLDPKGEHGMGDLLLGSFLRLVGIESVCSKAKVAIDLEYLTSKGNRIDLVIRGEDFAIGIENKIFHWVANDLEDYGNTLNNIKPKGADESRIGRVLLSPNPITGKNLSGFKSITYPMLWEEVRKHIGQHIGTADNKWLTYLIDFMETTENFSSKAVELNDSEKFVLANYASIEALIEAHDSFLNKLNRQVESLKGFVEEKLSTSPESKVFLAPKGVWIFQKSCLVLDNIFNGIGIAFDLRVQPKGWTLDILARSNANIGFLNQVVANMGNKNHVEQLQPGRLRIADWPLETGLEEIADYLLDANKRLAAAATIA